MAEYLGLNLKEMREAKGINQKQLAVAIGTDQGTVSKWENDKLHPPKQFYSKLTEALDLPADFFQRDWKPPFASYDIGDILGEWQTIKKRLEGLEDKVIGIDYSKPLPATPVSRFASLLRDADLVTLYACLYLLSGSKDDLEKVHALIKNEVVALRQHIRPLRSSSE